MYQRICDYATIGTMGKDNAVLPEICFELYLMMSYYTDPDPGSGNSTYGSGSGSESIQEKSTGTNLNFFLHKFKFKN